MKYLKLAGIAWGLVYFAVGAIKSFTLGSVDFWSGVAFFSATFLLPLPLAILAVWVPRIAGKAALGCIAVSFAAVFTLVVSHREFSFADVSKLIAFTSLYNAPHLFFGLGYIRGGRRRNNAGSGEFISSLPPDRYILNPIGTASGREEAWQTGKLRESLRR